MVLNLGHQAFKKQNKQRTQTAAFVRQLFRLYKYGCVIIIICDSVVLPTIVTNVKLMCNMPGPVKLTLTNYAHLHLNCADVGVLLARPHHLVNTFLYNRFTPHVKMCWIPQSCIWEPSFLSATLPPPPHRPTWHRFTMSSLSEAAAAAVQLLQAPQSAYISSRDRQKKWRQKKRKVQR